MENTSSGSRYVDYTSPGASAYRHDDDYDVGGRYNSSYDESYDHRPDRPPRRDRGTKSRSRDRLDKSGDKKRREEQRSAERLERRERSTDKLDRSQDGSVDRLDRSVDRSVDRLDRSVDRSVDRLDRSQDMNVVKLDRSVDRLDRSVDRLDRRDRSVDRLERHDRSLERNLESDIQIDRSLKRSGERRNRSYDSRLDRRERSFERLDETLHASIESRRNKSADRLDRSVDRGLNIADRSIDRRSDRHRGDSSGDGLSVDRSVDRRHRSRSREQLSTPFDGQVYLHPGSAAHRAPSEHAESEFTVRNETPHRSRAAVEEEERRAASRAASEIYATTRFPRPQSQMSQYTYRSGRGGSDVMSVKTKTTAGGKLVMETMTAPHPCCPNTRACCCLMILLNLALLLITLGFVVVLQLYDPPFVWYVGLSMLIFGFLVLFGSMIYCVFVCKEVEKLRPPPGELYWTNHWSKTMHVPEIHYSNQQNRPADYRGSEFSYKTENTDPSRLTNGNHTNSSMNRY